ncbi:hypothetical protein FDP41_002775 [Naegleria fowleri]|uniref:ATP-dependent (S)-NAD(P)H-hydrate dehydratase n=1 Tax=Naegleria fowleri TaxID=5763 RepID=A0A6A5BXB3_NAEFO|nr:uncharacterized protein FDP41_002775 [Naegleria fowleri]KAF0978260.1 hypothetical protein FDP41_002775 [Naegleria fowleri]CAG4710685.1 unnamed protein product [Naegleria fowleri]
MQRSSGAIISQLKQFLIPPLSHHAHKGQAGRIAVIGGSEEYTGAPYYSAISALKCGADLSFVICSKLASVIKSYSPELIVYPFMYEKSSVDYGTISETPRLFSQDDEFKQFMKNTYESIFRRINSVVLGPGLGRSKEILQQAEWFISYCNELNMPLVLDGDGLFLIGEKPELIQGQQNVILTPNPAEFQRLFSKVIDYYNKSSTEKVSSSQFKTELEELTFVSKALGNVCIVRKGLVDIISIGDHYVECEILSPSPRRCGGQGDVLTGLIATFSYWANWERKEVSTKLSHEEKILAACYGSCLVQKKAAQLAFAQHHRSTTTPNIIDKIGEAFSEAFKEDN